LASSREFRQAGNGIFLQLAVLYPIIGAAVFAVARAESAAIFVLATLFAWPLIGWCQFALFNALHEGLHNRFGAPHRRFLAYALCAWPLGFDEDYRQVHFDHHKHFGDPERDPDYPNYAHFPTTRGQMIRRFLRSAMGIAAMLQFFDIDDRPSLSRGAGRSRDWAPVLLTQGVIAGVFGLTAGWWYYPWLWLIPLATFAKFFTSTRTFCEHASPDGKAVVRTITGSFLGEKIFGVFCFHYHAEHHRFVDIPCNQLSRAHAALASEVYGECTEENARYELYERGYFQLLRGWYAALPR